MTEKNYELFVAGNEIEFVAKTVTESQVRCVLDHFVKQTGLKNLTISCKRVTPEPIVKYSDIELTDAVGTNTISWQGIPNLDIP